MSNFTSCPKCKASVLRGADECPQCGYAMRAVDRRAQSGIDKNEYARRLAERKELADYNARRYGLALQGETEELDVYESRINIQMTPLVCAELAAMEKRLVNHQNARNFGSTGPQRDRQPGEDDDL